MHTLYTVLTFSFGFCLFVYFVVKVARFASAAKSKIKFSKAFKASLLTSKLPSKIKGGTFSRFPHFLEKYLVNAFGSQKQIPKFSRLKFAGHYKADANKEWNEFKGISYISQISPLLTWDASLYLNPFVTLEASKSLAGGFGKSGVKFYSLIRSSISDDEEALKELYAAYYLYAPFIPAMFITSKSASWESLPERKVRAVFKNNPAVTEVFISFNDFNEISNIETSRIVRRKDKSAVETSFASLCFDGYERINGILIPTHVESVYTSGDKKQEAFSIYVKEVMLKF
jgi:hypothetical protein